jgi:hypothetical protein
MQPSRLPASTAPSWAAPLRLQRQRSCRRCRDCFGACSRRALGWRSGNRSPKPFAMRGVRGFREVRDGPCGRWGDLRSYWREHRDASAPEPLSGPLARRLVMLGGARSSAVQHLRRFPIDGGATDRAAPSGAGRLHRRLRTRPVADYVSRDSSKPAPYRRCRRALRQALGRSLNNLSEEDQSPTEPRRQRDRCSPGRRRLYGWVAAEVESEHALRAWLGAAAPHHAAPYLAYRAAVDREDAAARDLQRLYELARALSVAARSVSVAGLWLDDRGPCSADSE